MSSISSQKTTLNGVAVTLGEERPMLRTGDETQQATKRRHESGLLKSLRVREYSGEDTFEPSQP
jgi:hypothetical protein